MEPSVSGGTCHSGDSPVWMDGNPAGCHLKEPAADAPRSDEPLLLLLLLGAPDDTIPPN